MVLKRGFSVLLQVVPFLILGIFLVLPLAQSQSLSSGQRGVTLNVTSAYGWTSVWTRRGTSRTWDGIWTNGSSRVTTVMEGDIQGNQINLKRTSSTDGNLCEYRGTISPDERSASGTQICSGYPDMAWSATMAGTASVITSPASTVMTLNVTSAYGWTSVWTRRGTSRTWDGIWMNGSSRVTTVMEGNIQGNQINLKRTSSTDGNLCEYRGTMSSDGRSASGTQICSGYPDMAWSATIARRVR